jgi:hypothetical protein
MMQGTILWTKSFKELFQEVKFGKRFQGFRFSKGGSERREGLKRKT